MPLVRLHHRGAIEGWLRRDAPMHLYELGDLDDFFWPHTEWHALAAANGEIEALALMYRATELPVLLLLGGEDRRDAARRLLVELEPELPARFYAHLVPGILDALPSVTREPHGSHDRMVLTSPARLAAVDSTEAIALGPGDIDAALAFYRGAYPGNWFDARMLETGTYFGVRRDGELACVAGVHVVSRALRVAALGNIATAPAARRQGLARVATAAVGQSLARQSIDLIGLNVASDNAAAIALYRELGFERVGRYDEVLVTRG